MNQTLLLRGAALGLSLCCLALPSQARATAVGDREVGLAGAAVATGWEPGAIHYNPAGLARLRRGSLSLSANAYQLESQTLEGLVRSVLDDGSQVDSVYDSSGFMSFPASMIYARPFSLFGFKGGAALGLLVPEAGERHERHSMDEGYWATQMDVSTKTSVYVPTAGFGLAGKGWSLGAALNLRIAQSLEQYYYSDGSIESADSGDGENYQEMTFRSTDLVTAGLQPVLGLQLRLPLAWHLGLSFHSRPIHLYGSGTVSAVSFEGYPDWSCDPAEDDSSPGCWFYYDVESTAQAKEVSQGRIQVGLGRRQKGAKDAFEFTGTYWLAADEPDALITAATEDEDAEYVDFGDYAMSLPSAWAVAFGWERKISGDKVLRLGLSHRQDSSTLEANEESSFAQVWTNTGLSLGYGKRRAATATSKASSTDIALRYEHLAGQAVGWEWVEPADENAQASERYNLVDGSGYRILLVLGGSFELGGN